jgi:hypothetical protein
MAKSKSLPPHALRLATYAELERYVAAFAQGHLNLLLVIGPPGVGKSRCVRGALAGPVCWIGGQATPLGLYIHAYEHRHQPIVLDDVDGLYADRAGVRLLKALCQSETSKTLGWHTQAAALDRLAIPRRFSTRSRVALIGNDWQTCNADVAALEDRGHLILFEPTALEVHRQAARWFWDQEIFDLVATYLHLLARPSLRIYVQAAELKQAGLDWRQAVLGRCLRGTALAVAKLKADPSFASEAARVRAFVQSGAGCRATYFQHAKKLQPAQAPPDLALTHIVPPVETPPDHLDRLRHRFGHLGHG